MKKAVFIGLPSVSVANTLVPLMKKMAGSNFEIIYYNTSEFRINDEKNISFRTYPQYSGGYDAKEIKPGVSFFEFATLLVNTTEALVDFLIRDVGDLKPDFIVHSHLAPWGKLVSKYLGLRAVNIMTTFVLHENIMLPYLKTHKVNSGVQLNTTLIMTGLRAQRKLQSIYSRYNVGAAPPLWDIYINKESTNLCFILPEFQPKRKMIGSDFHYVGFPLGRQQKLSEDIMYVSMGTVFDKDLCLFNTILNVLNNFDNRCIVSSRNTITNETCGDLHSHIEVVPFVDQILVLRQSQLFISRGGMASVQEAVCCETPLIVIPEIPEQIATAERVEALGIGLHIPLEKLTYDNLLRAIKTIRANHAYYRENLIKLMRYAPALPATRLAIKYMEELLERTDLRIRTKRNSLAENVEDN